MQPDRSLHISKWLHTVIMVVTWLAAATLCLMVVVIVINVVGRYLFRLPLEGTVEIVELALVVTVVFAFAYTEVENGHVTMDEVVARFPRRVRTILMRIMYFAAAAFFFIISWVSLTSSRVALGRGMHTEAAVSHFSSSPHWPSYLQHVLPTGQQTMFLQLPAAHSSFA